MSDTHRTVCLLPADTDFDALAGVLCGAGYKTAIIGVQAPRLSLTVDWGEPLNEQVRRRERDLTSRIGEKMSRRFVACQTPHSVRAIGLAEVESAVCQLFGVTSDQIRAATGRRRSLSQPRMLAIFLARRHTAASYAEIGRYFGRNRTTVLWAERRVDGWLQGGAVKLPNGWSVGQALSAAERRLDIQPSA